MNQMLILMKGHPGCAKSTVSRALARALRCPLVDKDDIRDATLPLEDPDRPAPPAPTVLNTLSYDVMWRIVETQLQIGLSTVVDSPLARPALFQIGSGLAERYGCTLVIVECVAGDLSEWKRRLEARARAALDPVIEDETRVMITSLGDSAYASSSEKHLDSLETSSNVFNQENKFVGPMVDVIDSFSATGSRVPETCRHWHKPSLWEDIEKLLEGYARCYEYDTGLTKKMVVDTTAISTEAAIVGIVNWLKCLDTNSQEIVSYLP
ncbi:hypothetical protein R1flu_021725 [Riccia fluitans]|uniref:P-loop containing nucleoside triphosphate hydrolase protein n=1 Tax=Riccia fluitans TaxID=41844 RepID=A0ABD1ZQ79_9MARC